MTVEIWNRLALILGILAVVCITGGITIWIRFPMKRTIRLLKLTDHSSMKKGEKTVQTEKIGTVENKEIMTRSEGTADTVPLQEEDAFEILQEISFMHVR